MSVFDKVMNVFTSSVKEAKTFDEVVKENKEKDENYKQISTLASAGFGALGGVVVACTDNHSQRTPGEVAAAFAVKAGIGALSAVVTNVAVGDKINDGICGVSNSFFIGTIGTSIVRGVCDRIVAKQVAANAEALTEMVEGLTE